MAKQTIKQTLEVLEATKVLGVIGMETFSDGVQLGDIMAIKKIAEKFDVLKEAVNGLDLIDDELKDIDAEEAKELLGKVFEVIKAVKEAKK